jgi:hypothetical protein
VTIFPYTMSDRFVNLWELEDDEHPSGILRVESLRFLEGFVTGANACSPFIGDHLMNFGPRPTEKSFLPYEPFVLVLRGDGISYVPILFGLLWSV